MNRCTRITVRGVVDTYCPKYDLQTQADVNSVEISWEPLRHVDAEDISALIATFYHRKTWCEDLARDLANAACKLLGGTVKVVVRQEIGHSVEAEAFAS